MSTSTVNIAIIGLGVIGKRQAQYVQSCPEATLCAFVEPFIMNHQTAASSGVPSYVSVEELLRCQKRVDAAIVCTPNDTHVEIAMKLAEAGIHLLVEKPLSSDIESGRILVKFAQKAGVKLLVGHHRRFNPFILAAKNAIPSLGKVTLVNGLWTTLKSPKYFLSPTEWRRGPTGGPVLINMIHEVDILHYLFGPIKSVVGEKTLSRRGYEAEEGGALAIAFRSGVVATFAFCDNVPSPHNIESGTGENDDFPYTGMDFCRIFGSEASLSLPDMTRWSYDGSLEKSWWGHLTKEQWSADPGEPPWKLQLDHFIRVIKSNETPVCSGEDGLQALIVVKAIKEALETGNKIHLSLE